MEMQMFPQGLYINVQMYCLYVWNRNVSPLGFCISLIVPTQHGPHWNGCHRHLSTFQLHSTLDLSNWVCVVREGDGNANVHRAFCANIELDLFRWWKYKSFVRIIGHQLKKDTNICYSSLHCIVMCSQLNWTWPALEWAPQAPLNISTALNNWQIENIIVQFVQPMEIQMFCIHNNANSPWRHGTSQKHSTLPNRKHHSIMTRRHREDTSIYWNLV